MTKTSNPGRTGPTVLQIIPELDAGGAERTTIDVAQAVVDSGGTAIVASRGGRLAGELAQAGGTLLEVPVHSKNPLTMIQNIFRLRQIIIAHHVDVIHVRSRAPAWSALVAARWTKVPLVTTYHGTYQAKSASKRFYNSGMIRGDRIIANSNFIAEHIATTYPDLRTPVDVIQRGSNLDWFDPSKVGVDRVENLKRQWGIEDDGRLIVLLPGRLTRWKGQEVFIEALSQLVKDGVTNLQAVLVGDAQGRDEYVAGLVDSIGAHSLSPYIHLAGHCDDMPAALAVADLVVSASIEPEAFGRIAVEAQAMGKPIIATDHGGSRESVITGDQIATGWRVLPGDADDMARGLAQALSLSKDLRDEMGQRGRANAIANFSVGVMCQKTLDIYHQLCGT